MNQPHQPLPVDLAPDPVERDFEPLLREPFARAWAGDDNAGPQPVGLRGRLLDRIAASRAQAGGMFTARRSRLAAVELAAGVQARTLYAAADDRALRPGEPLRVRLIELAAGSRWAVPATDGQLAWLVLQGSVQLDDERLQVRDFHWSPAAGAAPVLQAHETAVLMLREAGADASAGLAPLTVRDEDAGWPDYAPGIQRRVLWQHAGQAAMLYYTQPGARVPLHSHGHDEECLMVQGELFLDDVLLRAGDYQLAPAGTSHRITETDTGVVIFAHGDLDLRFVA